MLKIADNELQWVINTLQKVEKKMHIVANSNKDKIPYTTTPDGKFDDWTNTDIAWWTNGFWGGIMWQLYNLTKEPIYKENAEVLEKKLDRNLMLSDKLDHDNGFKWGPTALANYFLTENQESANRAMLAACNLAGRFNLNGKYIRAWNDDSTNRSGLAIVDCLMNLPILYWATKESGDPRFSQIAMAHAFTAQKYLVRPNGSVKHIIEFNPHTGEYLKSHGGQGLGHGSAWTRGQAWALYGFALSYHHTKEDQFLSTAKQVADYFISNIPENGLIPIDFCASSDQPMWQDDSAAAIAACGLLQIADLVEDAEESQQYINAALRLLHALTEKSCNFDTDTDNLLMRCSAAYHERNHEYPIIYGDYFYLEALLTLSKQGLFIW
ncbi:glycoside hydrolase family 88 protein [Niallia sp.]|uniref:glycoside hydrolase family 88 protein n=1 Tax=Niallia sp. TaxID=2837523 RepID=UPI002897BA69|nr:glycoside hydrolase family 88 protein [Niallia sp.]